MRLIRYTEDLNAKFQNCNGYMSEKGKANFYNMLITTFNNAILLMSMGTN